MNIEEEIKKLGWSQWYNPDYWINGIIIPRYLKKRCDYTNYGVSKEQAYKISTLPLEKRKYLKAIHSAIEWGKFINKPH